MPKLLDKAELQTLPGKWVLAEDGKSIRQSFVFKNFAEAFSFMTHVALLAEKANHHPDWANAYNRVEIRLSTHEADGVTGKDIALAKAINAFVWLPQ